MTLGTIATVYIRSEISSFIERLLFREELTRVNTTYRDTKRNVSPLSTSVCHMYEPYIRSPYFTQWALTQGVGQPKMVFLSDSHFVHLNYPLTYTLRLSFCECARSN